MKPVKPYSNFFTDRSKEVYLLWIIFVVYVSCLSCFVVCSLKERYEQFLEQRMESDEKMSKLRTYKLVKNKFGIEKHLELNERNLRKSLADFRISAHKLNIERGRY